MGRKTKESLLNMKCFDFEEGYDCNDQCKAFYICNYICGLK